MMRVENVRLRFIASALLSFAGITALCAIANSAFFSYSFVWILLWGICCLAGAQWMAEKKSAAAKWLSWMVAAAFLFFQAVGYQLDLHGGSNTKSLLLCFAASIGLAPSMAFLIMLFLKSEFRAADSDIGVTGFYWLRSSLFLFLAWFIVFLAYYPGLFAYDAHSQLEQYLNHQITSWHPPLHTFYLGFFYTLGEKLGSYNIGFALHILSQMAILAAIYSYIIYDLRRTGCKKSWCSCFLVFLGFFPVHSILSISCTKDVLFTGFFVLAAYQIYQLWINPTLFRNYIFCIRLLLFIVLACLLRNNACYGLMLFFPFAIFLPKISKNRFGLFFLACFVLSFSSYRVMQNLFPDYAMSTRESLSIPAQQLSRAAVILNDSHTTADADETITEIKQFIPVPRHYNAFRSDAVKAQLMLGDSSQTKDFLKLWIRVGLRHPLTYFDAFLLNTQGMWRIDDTTHAAMYGYGLENRQGYLLTDTKEGWQISHHSYFPALESLYEHLFSANEYQKLPILSLLFSPALYVWITILLTVRTILKQQWAILAVCCFSLCYSFTLLLGPCVLVRYCYFLFVCTPLSLILSFKTAFPKNLPAQ